jgi:hypothetical protein
VAIALVLSSLILMTYLSNPGLMLSQWRWGYEHLTTTSAKVRLINKQFSEVTLCWPGGCGLIPGWEMVRFVSWDPLVLEAVDSAGRNLPFRCIGDLAYQYESAEYPIIVTFRIAGISDHQLRLSVSAERTVDERR